MRSIKERFGSHRGYLNHLRARCALLIGAYSSLERIDWKSVQRLVFVCTGNVCRSPYAEAVARARGSPTLSFGLNTTGNVPANEAAQRVARARGVELAQHRSTSFDLQRLAPSDLLIGFEPHHVEGLRAAGAGQRAQLTLLGLWEPGYRRPYIADPYGRSDAYFGACFDDIDRALARILVLAGNP